MRNIAILIAALIFATAAPISVGAKPLGIILAQSGLSPKDLELLSATEKQLYSPTVKTVGSKLSWTNPDTGAHGTVRLAEVRGNCVFIQHVVYPKGEKKPVELRPHLCKAADGRWLLEP